MFGFGSAIWLAASVGVGTFIGGKLGLIIFVVCLALWGIALCIHPEDPDSGPED